MRVQANTAQSQKHFPSQVTAAQDTGVDSLGSLWPVQLQTIRACQELLSLPPLMNLEYVSVGCNRVAHALDWSPTGEVAYGAHNAVAIYNVEVHLSPCRFLTEMWATWFLSISHKLQAAAVEATLQGHSGRVNCVQWLPNAGMRISHPLLFCTRCSVCNEGVNVPPFAGDGAGSATQVLASGDADGMIRVWKRMPQHAVPWEAAACLKVH